jgi:formylglycine-generating enzyme required for sulfatase activity
VDVNTGQQYAWGLKNYIGNVQEWVTNGSSLEARGGAYSDAHSKCGVTLTRPHNGQADETTGFRVLLEEVG